MSLVVPTHVERARQRQAANITPAPTTVTLPGSPTINPDDKVTIYSLDRALPKVVPSRLHPYRMYVMLVGLKNQSQGGILMPDEYIDAQYYNHCLGRIVAMGPCCFKGRRWEDIGYADQSIFLKLSDKLDLLWHTAISRILPGVFRAPSPKYYRRPHVGDFITFNPRAPVRETWSDTLLLIMNDDDWRSSPTRDEVDHLRPGF